MDLTKVRMREHSGIVTNDTSTTQLTFIISPLKNRARVEKNDYIVLPHPTLGETFPVLATIKEIKGYEQVVGSTLSEKVGKMLATAQIIGYINTKDKTKQIKALTMPPNPGSRVYLVYSEFLQEVFNTDIHGNPFNSPLHIGKAIQTAINQKEDTKQLNYHLDPKCLTDTHTLITAMDDTGKTHAAKVIIEELATKTQQPIMIFDPYDEYNTNQTQQPDYTTVTITAQERITKEIKSKQVTIITSQDIEPKKRNSFYSQCLKTLWKARLEATIPSFTLVIENAEKIDLETLEQTVYEGTKHGLALILITKQPAQLGTNILAQMNTQLIGKTTDSNYLNQLETTLPQHTTKIPHLKQKEWIIHTNSQMQTTQITTRNHCQK